jgi:hypothetical protein
MKAACREHLRSRSADSKSRVQAQPFYGPDLARKCLALRKKDMKILSWGWLAILATFQLPMILHLRRLQSRAKLWETEWLCCQSSRLYYNSSPLDQPSNRNLLKVLHQSTQRPILSQLGRMWNWSTQRDPFCRCWEVQAIAKTRRLLDSDFQTFQCLWGSMWPIHRYIYKMMEM